MIIFLFFVRRDGAVGADEDGYEGHDEQASVGDHHPLGGSGHLTQPVNIYTGQRIP